VLARGELTEIFGGFGNNIVVELEDDATSGLAVNSNIELCLSDTR